MLEQAQALTEDQAVEKLLALKNPQQAQVVKEPEQQQAPSEEQTENEADLENAPQEETEAHEGDENAEPVMVEVILDGEKVSITLEEALSGYQQAAVSQKKFREAAELKQQAEEELVVLKQLPSVFENINTKLAEYEQVNHLLDVLMPAMPPDEVLKNNPALYIRAKEAREQVSAKRNEITAAVDALKKQQAEALAVAQSHAHIKLKQEMPEVLTDTGKAQLVSYLTQSMGFEPEQITTAADHRLFVMAEKARRYDDLMSKPVIKKKEQEKVTHSKTTQRQPANTKAQSVSKAMDRLRQSKSVDDGVAAYLAMKKT